MKVIDLLNKIANGEEPKKIKYNGNVYEYEEYGYFSDDIGYIFDKYYPSGKVLNDEVEIIEEDKKIEKLNDNDLELETINTRCWEYNFSQVKDKINEIIEVLNEKIFNNA